MKLKLKLVNGEWTTPDGMTTIGRAMAVTYCDNPHPERWKENGFWKSGHCSGGEEHDYVAGWDIRGNLYGLNDDLYPTLKDARTALAKAMGLES
jgi:hypothetical protein